MSAHTPGPWTYEKQMSSGPSLAAVSTLFAHGDVIGRIYQSDNDGNAQANARLIAAAPDLLEALQAMLTVHDHGECEAMHPDTAERMAREAIAKAVQS